VPWLPSSLSSFPSFRDRSGKGTESIRVRKLSSNGRSVLKPKLFRPPVLQLSCQPVSKLTVRDGAHYLSEDPRIHPSLKDSTSYSTSSRLELGVIGLSNLIMENGAEGDTGGSTEPTESREELQLSMGNASPPSHDDGGHMDIVGVLASCI
jgi:hypothetical protein